ncbi:hypothetical protein [Paracoccus marinaquae]|uniref:AAA domain-containing protein n=1 Tax=Paracoccus marinaquae TaxID=2841926 RepID=A0ABS6ANY7_9RHOB|nr:hypothetical protein [Paracoccus marinaquae]MBU3032308.1 hypothetical protein [Paracoccus marinaquae]
MLTKPIISEIFVETKAVKRVRDAIEFAMISPYPAHIISSPGRGKTTALYHLAREYDGAYIEIGAQQKTMSVPEVLGVIRDYFARQAATDAEFIVACATEFGGAKHFIVHLARAQPIPGVRAVESPSTAVRSIFLGLSRSRDIATGQALCCG